MNNITKIFLYFIILVIVTGLPLHADQKPGMPSNIASIIHYCEQKNLSCIIGGEYIGNLVERVPTGLKEEVTSDQFKRILKENNLIDVVVLGIHVITPASNRKNLYNLKFFPENTVFPEQCHFTEGININIAGSDLKTIFSGLSDVFRKACIDIKIPDLSLGTISAHCELKNSSQVTFLNVLKLMANINGYDILPEGNILVIKKLTHNDNVTPLKIPIQENIAKDTSTPTYDNVGLEKYAGKKVYLKGDYDEKIDQINFTVINGELRPFINLIVRDRKYPRFLEIVTTPVIWEEIDGKNKPFTTMKVGEREIKVRVTEVIVRE